MKSLTLPKTSASLLSVIALAAAIQFSPSRLAAEMGLRGDSSIPAYGSSQIGRAPAPAPAAPSSHWEGRHETAGTRDSARSAVRQIEADARELYSLNARAIRHGSRDEIAALNRLNDLQRAASELTITLDRRDCSPEVGARQYSAFYASYEAARNSWRALCNVRGANDFTVRIERCFSPVNIYFRPPVAFVSWNDVRRAADDMEDAAEDLFDAALREAKENCDHRTHDARVAAIEQLRALREAARNFDSRSERSGGDPGRSRDDFRRLVRALDYAQNGIRAFGRHTQRDFAELDSLVHGIEPFYFEHRHDSRGGSWDHRGADFGSPRVIGSAR